jgi:hypothetical protein
VVSRVPSSAEARQTVPIRAERSRTTLSALEPRPLRAYPGRVFAGVVAWAFLKVIRPLASIIRARWVLVLL